MTRRTIPMTVPMGKAAGVLPRTLQVGTASLDIDLEGETITTGLGRGVRYKARWTKGPRRSEAKARWATGNAHIDIIQTSKMTAEMAVGLSSPKGLGRILWSGTRLHRLAELFARALRYQVETRASERADGFEVRRIPKELMKARIA